VYFGNCHMIYSYVDAVYLTGINLHRHHLDYHSEGNLRAKKVFQCADIHLLSHTLPPSRSVYAVAHIKFCSRSFLGYAQALSGQAPDLFNGGIQYWTIPCNTDI
jgi:hypothetical protein